MQSYKTKRARHFLEGNGALSSFCEQTDVSVCSYPHPEIIKGCR